MNVSMFCIFLGYLGICTYYLDTRIEKAFDKVIQVIQVKK